MSTGVYEDKLKNGKKNFRASLTYQRKHISLGSYKTFKQAEAAYRYATDLLKSDRDILSYPDKCPLLFEKYVSIVNLRDNGIYFPNPIYLEKRVFRYYLSPDRALLFDMDDLFYFSSHKIMERGGRFFISEYGMQTGLRERFGIMSFAVAGRDFLFINGDPLDHRRENIEIINRYRGVRKKETLTKTSYKAVIHLRSDSDSFPSELLSFVFTISRKALSGKFFSSIVTEPSELTSARTFIPIPFHVRIAAAETATSPQTTDTTFLFFICLPSPFYQNQIQETTLIRQRTSRPSGVLA